MSQRSKSSETLINDELLVESREIFDLSPDILAFVGGGGADDQGCGVIRIPM